MHVVKKTISYCLVMFFVFPLLFLQTQAATTYYVDATNGNNDNNGSHGFPWKTITFALTQISSGDTINVAAGTYNAANGETFPLSPSSNTTLTGADSATTIISGSNNTFDLRGDIAVSDVVISGFTITTASGQSGHGIELLNVNNIIIENNIIRNNGNDGINLWTNADNVTIRNNFIYSNAENGIQIASNDVSSVNDGLTISNNVIYSNTSNGLWINPSSNPIIINNTIYGNGNMGLGIGNFIASTATVTNNIISNHSIGLSKSSNTTLTNTFNNIVSNTTNYSGGAFAGTGDISADPQYVSTLSGSENFRLQTTSPSINTGAVVAVTTDIVGNTRPYGSAYDMGAYENDNTAPSVGIPSPVSGATSVARDSNISFPLTDADSGVDTSAIAMTVNGISVIPTATAISTPNSYTVSYNPPSDFSYGATVTVAVTVADLASTPNTDSKSWSFTTVADSTASAISNQSPASGATSVSADANVSFILTDSETGVDTSTLGLTVGGIAVTPIVTGVSTPNSYSVLYDSSSNFTAGSSVTVSVSVSDLALSANTLSTSWSFTVASSSGSSGIAGGSSLPSSPISQGSSPIIPDISSSIDVIESTPAETSSETAPASSLEKSSAWRIDPALRELISEHIDNTDDPERLACEGFTQKDLQAARALFRNIAQAKITVSRFIYSLLPEIAGTISDLADISIMVESDLSEQRVSMKNGEISLKIYLNALSKKLDVMWGINIDHVLIASREYFETHYFKTIDLSDKQSVVLDCPWMVMKASEPQEPTIEPEPPVEPTMPAESEPTVESTTHPATSEVPTDQTQHSVESAMPAESEPVSEFETPVEQEISAESALPLEPTAVPELTTLSELETVSEPESNTSDLAGGSSLTAALVAETPIETVTVSAVTDLGCEMYSGSSDEDIDGLSDRLECVYGTDPKNAQTNGENLDSDIVINRVDLLASAVVSTMEPAQSDAQPASPVFIAITNYNGATKTASSTPLFRGVATPTDASVCIWAENTSGNTRELGCSAISENQKFLFKTPEPLLDDTYTVTAKLVQFGTVVSESAPVTLSIYSSFDIDPPSVQKLGDVVIPLEIQNVPDQLKIFPIRFRMKRPALSGNAEYNNTVFIDWQSAIFSSALIADTGSGAFTSVTPTELEVGDHSVWMYAVNPELGIRSDEVEVHFTIAEVGESLLRLFAVQGGIAVFVIAGAIFFYAVFFQKKFLKKKRRSGNQV